MVKVRFNVLGLKFIVSAGIDLRVKGRNFVRKLNYESLTKFAAVCETHMYVIISHFILKSKVLSSGPYLKIEFIANSDKPGTGFRASYKFVKVELDTYLDNTRQLPLPGT